MLISINSKVSISTHLLRMNKANYTTNIILNYTTIRRIAPLVPCRLESNGLRRDIEKKEKKMNKNSCGNA